LDVPYFFQSDSRQSFVSLIDLMGYYVIWGPSVDYNRGTCCAESCVFYPVMKSQAFPSFVATLSTRADSHSNAPRWNVNFFNCLLFVLVMY